MRDLHRQLGSHSRAEVDALTDCPLGVETARLVIAGGEMSRNRVPAVKDARRIRLYPSRIRGSVAGLDDNGDGEPRLAGRAPEGLAARDPARPDDRRAVSQRCEVNLLWSAAESG
jgi:hypothetical protein